MITYTTASSDATIYERNNNPDRSEQNTGLDSMLEILKEESSLATYNAYRSRILVKFDSDFMNEDDNFYLKLYETGESAALPSSFNVTVNYIERSWDMGTGNKNDLPMIENGVSWLYRSNLDNTTAWVSSGGDYDTGSTAQTCSYEYNTSDILVNVSEMINSMSAGDITNNGIMLKLSDTDEQSSGSLALSFYSTETNTIYQPRLFKYSDDFSWTTGSLTPLDMTNNILAYTYDIRGRYKQNSEIKLRVIGRELYPTKTYATESVNTVTSYYLPSSSYYSIIDDYTDEVLIPFDDTYTKISCDSTSNYFNLNTSNFEKDRYYKIVYKIVSGSQELYFDNKYLFEIV